MSKGIRVFRNKKKINPGGDDDEGEDSPGEEDTPDENEPVLVTEGAHENAKPPQPDLPDNVAGYTNVSTTLQPLPPPPALYVPPAGTEQTQPEYTNVPVISEEAARMALLEHVAQQCCWGKGAAQKLTFVKLQSSTSYHYILESYTEGRSTEWAFEDFRGQPVDGPEGGPAPAPWQVEARPSNLFQNEVRAIEVPHTAIVKECHVCCRLGYLICSTCKGRGKNRCGACHGRGTKNRRRKTKKGWKTTRVRCFRCSGHGKRRCDRCVGTGRVTCGACKGHCSLKWFVRLTTKWTNRMGQHIIERTALPDEMIAGVKGNLVFQDQQPRVIPISGFHDDEINQHSSRLVGMHAKNFPNDAILMQRHTIRAVPVTQCYYELKGNNQQYIVFGLENSVYAPEYPDTCCWGCTIL